jgi:hypothetical protein
LNFGKIKWYIYHICKPSINPSHNFHGVSSNSHNYCKRIYRKITGRTRVGWAELLIDWGGHRPQAQERREEATTSNRLIVGATKVHACLLACVHSSTRRRLIAYPDARAS